MTFKEFFDILGLSARNIKLKDLNPKPRTNKQGIFQ